MRAFLLALFGTNFMTGIVVAFHGLAGDGNHPKGMTAALKMTLEDSSLGLLFQDLR